MAYNYQYGPFKIRDYDKAIFYYKKLPTMPKALYELGNIYSNNPYDEDKSREYYTKSASYDYIPALKALADFHNHWTGNEIEATKLYNKIISVRRPGDYAHVDEYVGSIFELYNKYKSTNNNAEKDRLSKLMNDKNEAKYLWGCPTAALYEFNTTDKARLSSDILERLYGPLSSNPHGSLQY